MSIYIYKNNQQSGPFEDDTVLKWLKTGQLSPEDIACRQGASEWQPLRKLFPDLVGSAVIPNPSPTASQVSVEEKSGSGCRRILGTLMLILGILLFVGGIGGAIVNGSRTKPDECVLADKAKAGADQAVKDYEAAKGTPREFELQEKANTKIKVFEIWAGGCGERKDYYRWWFTRFLISAFFGLILSITGFFIKRVKATV